MMKKRRVPPVVVLAQGLVVFSGTAVIPFLDRSKYPHLFVASMAIAACAYIRTLRLVDRVSAGSRQALLLGLALAAFGRIPFLLMPPTLSSDVYRYVWDGTIQRFGYNPYLLVPTDRLHPELHTSETRLMNHPELTTPYPAEQNSSFAE